MILAMRLTRVTSHVVTAVVADQEGWEAVGKGGVEVLFRCVATAGP